MSRDPADLAMQLAQRTGGSLAPEPSQQRPTQPIAVAPDSAFFPSMTAAKEKRTADELAAMIVADLGEVKGCPKRGLKVAVYGSNPWNAWLSFGADAGAVPNKTELQDFLEIITERLKRLYDVAL